jgi:hypothetical protein
VSFEQIYFPFNGQLESLSVNPLDERDVLVAGLDTAYNAHVWRCENPMPGVSLWFEVASNIASPLPVAPTVSSIARDPSDPTNVWYLGTNVGVFYTGDAGSHWYNATQPLGLPAVPVTQLTVVPGTGYLMAATFGRGIWRAKLGCQPTTCAAVGANCGTISDGCGFTLDCGDSCPAGQVCGGGGQSNVCGCKTCGPNSCGTMSDGCGGTIACGTCGVGQVCSGNQCIAQSCRPPPRGCPKGTAWSSADCTCEGW